MLHRNTAHSRIEKSVLFVCGRNGLFIIISMGRWCFEDLVKTYSHLFMLFQKMSLLSDGCAFISAQPQLSSICVPSKAWAFHQRDSIWFFSFVWSVFYLSPVSSDGVRRSRAQAMTVPYSELSAGLSDIAGSGESHGGLWVSVWTGTGCYRKRLLVWNRQLQECRMFHLSRSW